MNAERETAYGFVCSFVAFLVLVLIVMVAVRKPNPKVTIVLTYPSLRNM